MSTVEPILYITLSNDSDWKETEIENTLRRIRGLDECPNDVRPIKLWIDSPGGNAEYAFRLIECLYISRRELAATARLASSSAALVFIACGTRKLMSDGAVGLHGIDICIPISSLDGDGRVPPLVLATAQTLEAKMGNLLRTHTKLTTQEISEILKDPQGRLFRPAAALEKGLATEIVIVG